MGLGPPAAGAQLCTAGLAPGATSGISLQGHLCSSWETGEELEKSSGGKKMEVFFIKYHGPAIWSSSEKEPNNKSNGITEARG